jgi:hypothetical protein
MWEPHSLTTVKAFTACYRDSCTLLFFDLTGEGLTEEAYSSQIILETNYIYIPSTLLTNGDEPFLRSRQLGSPSRTSQHFMEHEGAIPWSQEPSTGPYPEPYQSNLNIELDSNSHP